jgi:hypothetical protein
VSWAAVAAGPAGCCEVRLENGPSLGLLFKTHFDFCHILEFEFDFISNSNFTQLNSK